MLQASYIHTPGAPFIELQSVDSTNNYARQLIQQGGLPDRQGEAQHGMVIFAHEQTAGRGQRGRVWTSEPRKNIAMSILLKPHPLRPDQQFLLSACMAVSVHDFFKSYAVDKVSIKWPNDLYWQDRKAGGILIESIVGEAVWQWAIAGIGININQVFFPEHLPNPVSLKQITGSDYKVLPLAKKLCTIINRNYEWLINGGDKEILDQYRQCLYKKDQVVKFRKENRVFEAVVKGVQPSGKLIVQHATTEEFDFGEVEWVI